MAKSITGQQSDSTKCQIILKIFGYVSCECSVTASRPLLNNKKGATQTTDTNDWVRLCSKTLDFKDQVVGVLLFPDS